MSHTATRIIKGHKITPAGLYEMQELVVRVTPMGVAYDPVTNEQLTVRRRQVVKGVYEEIIGNGIWMFTPVEGECERCGIVVDYQK